MRIILCLLFFLASARPAAVVLEPISTAPHNKDCYSQGIFFLNQTHIFESCGMYNKSYFHILEYDPIEFSFKETFVTSNPWIPNVFLEGCVLFKGFIYLMTWREHQVYKLDSNNFEIVETLEWKRQGWGLTTNSTHLFATDGSNMIFLLDESFSILEQKEITTESGRKLFNINELQFKDGFIYANIYMNRMLVKIDYERGKAVKEYDCFKIIQAERKNNEELQYDEVLNGIAMSGKQTILTGKDWSQFYRVDGL